MFIHFQNGIRFSRAFVFACAIIGYFCVVKIPRKYYNIKLSFFQLCNLWQPTIVVVNEYFLQTSTQAAMYHNRATIPGSLPPQQLVGKNPRASQWVLSHYTRIIIEGRFLLQRSSTYVHNSKELALGLERGNLHITQVICNVEVRLLLFSNID